ncbi:MAG TPA: hypothetical protein VGJ22_05500, partial [Anaerolineales bacterium]
VIPGKQSATRDLCAIAATLTGRMGPGSRRLRGASGMMGWTFPLFGDGVRFVCETNRPNREGEGP